MRKNLYIGIMSIICLWAMVMDIKGAAITMADLPYLCDFEDETENANWVLNPSVNTIITENRWVIGDAVAYTGNQSLYVSQDGGQSNTYASTNNVLLAYRDITLEMGEYDIAYDWRGLGNKTKGYLKVIYANRPTSGLKCLGNSTEPTWVKNAVQLMGEHTSLIDGDTWYHVQARVTIPKAQANKTTTRLLFVWVNTDVTVKDSITSIAIDNFQLAKASPTDYPTNIHVTTTLGESEVSWEGSSDSYEVLYRKRGEEDFQSVQTNTTSVTLSNVDYGAYEFWICSVNGEDKTVYSVFPTIYLYETDCFDALNMYNASFEYGKWSWGRVTGIQKEIKGSTRVDYGPEDVRSRHTTHFDKSEVDPRTVVKNGRDTVACLTTIPSGEFGSVRLGNWNTGSEYESMTFHYTVESQSTAVLLIRYAMVLENPDHTADEQPRFTLDVLDESGEPIDVECASVDFHAPTSKEWQDPEVQAIWHELTWYDPKGGSSSGHLVNWQDWKTIGISVEEYVGQTLTIILTAYDCSQGGHFGYAYFTLNCVRSDVDGLPWGDGSTTRMFTAPEGFDYAWFNRMDQLLQDTLSRERFFPVIENDTNTYLCHVTYPTNAACGYWFDASAKSYNTQAELAYRWTPANCENGYTWWNRCHIILTNQQTGEVEHRYDKQMENCWLLTDDETGEAIGYTDEGNYVAMPKEGGHVHFGVRTGIYVNDQLYADTVWYDFDIPAIEAVETHLYDTICRGQSLIFPAGSHSRHTEPGDYTDYLQSVVTDCDSTVIMHLFVHEPKEATIFDTICPDGRYSFAGKTYTRSGIYTGLFMSEETGCDSVVTLYLKQAPRPTVALLSAQLCSDESLVFTASDGGYIATMHVSDDIYDTTAWMRHEDAQIILPLQHKDVGTHTAIVRLTMPWCDTEYADTLTYGVSLASGIIVRHWNDMLTFLSEEHNGGLTFQSYQWYANGEPIEGANQSYLYDPNMQEETEYTVRVTLSDGSEAWVCPFTPSEADRWQGIDGTEEERNNEKIWRNGRLIIRRNGREYDVLGRIIE